MEYKKILLALELIEGELDDASNQLPDYNANSDAQVSLDCARNELYCLKDDIERAILDENQKVTLDEVMNTSPTLAKGL
jgi:hypothetical protein|tara:strand:+ start:108 stop:344 length:237 start_codon:yes stop_codon:yes gene_type:complete